MIRPMGKLFTSLEALLGGVFGAAFSFFAPISPFVWLAFGLVIADTITGTIAALHRREKVTSKGMYRFPVKLAVYAVSIAACHSVSKVLAPTAPLAYIAVCAVAAVELKSILENTRIVAGVDIFQQLKNILPGVTITRKKKNVESEEE